MHDEYKTPGGVFLLVGSGFHVHAHTQARSLESTHTLSCLSRLSGAQINALKARRGGVAGAGQCDTDTRTPYTGPRAPVCVITYYKCLHACVSVYVLALPASRGISRAKSWLLLILNPLSAEWRRCLSRVATRCFIFALSTGVLKRKTGK
jgi:hypothetical protein